jgi:hypothetical protein
MNLSNEKTQLLTLNWQNPFSNRTTAGFVLETRIMLLLNTHTHLYTQKTTHTHKLTIF